MKSPPGPAPGASGPGATPPSSGMLWMIQAHWQYDAESIAAGLERNPGVVATANHLDLEPIGFANGEVGVVTRAADGTLAAMIFAVICAVHLALAVAIDAL